MEARDGKEEAALISKKNGGRNKSGEKRRQAGRRWPCDGGGRAWREAATSQEHMEPQELEGAKRALLPPEPLEDNQPCPLPHFRPLTSRL